MFKSLCIGRKSIILRQRLELLDDANQNLKINYDVQKKMDLDMFKIDQKNNKDMIDQNSTHLK